MTSKSKVLYLSLLINASLVIFLQKRCGKKIDWTSLTSTSGLWQWEFDPEIHTQRTIKSSRMTFVSDSPLRAIQDTSSSVIKGPKDAVDSIALAIEATFNETLGVYTIGCKKDYEVSRRNKRPFFILISGDLLHWRETF